MSELPKKIKSRWRRGGQRQSLAIMIEDSRWVRNARGVFRRVVDSVSEVVYVNRRREPFGWHRGARVRKS